MLDSFLKKATIVSLFIIPFMPLIVVNGFFFPFITGKNMLFRVLIEVAAAAYAILAVRNPQYRPRWSIIAGSLIAFLVFMGVATLLSENPFKSFWSNFERMEGYITLLHLGVYFMVLSSVFQVEKLWYRFLATNVAVSVLLSVYGLFQLGGVFVINQGGVRLDATIGNAAYLAVYMLLMIGLTVFLIARTRIQSTPWYLFLGALFLQLVTIYHTATRGALLGLLVGSAVAAILLVFFGNRYPKIRLTAGVTLGVVILLVGSVILLKDTALVKNSDTLSRMASISLEAGKARIEIWGIAIQGFQERPVFGWGQESFNYVFNKYYTPELSSQEPWFDRAHNIFLDWLIAGGILGLVGYLALYLSLAYLVWKTELTVPEKAILSGLVAGFFVNNFFVFDNITSYFLFFALLAYIHYLNARPMEWKIPSSDEKRAFTRVVAPIVIVLLLPTLYFVNIKQAIASNHLLQALSGQPDVSVNLDFFKRALALQPFASQEIAEQLVQTAINVGNAEQIPLEKKEAFFTFARDEMQKQIDRAPNDARLYVFMGSFLRLFGQNPDAVTFLEKAHMLSPGKQTILFELAFVHLTEGNPTKAFEYARQAYESNKEFDTARITYAVVALYAGNADLATQLLTERFGSIAVDNDMLLRALYDTKNFGAVLEIWKKRVEANEGDARRWLSLGSAYYAAGDSKKAVEAIERAILLDPAIEKEARQYINEIQGGGR